MSDKRQYQVDDLALYAMQLVNVDETAEIERQLQISPDLRRELAEVQGDLAIYATTVEMHSPPVLTRERLLTQIGRERKVRSIDRFLDGQSPEERSPELAARSAYGAGPGTATIPERYTDSTQLIEDDLPRPVNGLGRLVPWFGWAVAAALAVTTGNFYHENEAMRELVARDHTELARRSADVAAARELMNTLKDPTATHVTLTGGKQAPAPQGRVTYVAEKGALLFVASNLDPLDTYKVYELWLIPANGEAPVPAGTFHPDAQGNASVILPQLPAGLQAKAFGVTLEDEGGSSTPTMPILLAGTATGA